MSLTCDTVRQYYDTWRDQIGNNKWIRFPDYHCVAYLRVPLRGRYLDPDEPEVPCMDLAALQVDDNEQRKGHGLRFLEDIEALATEERLVLYIEAVNVPWLRESLKLRGYTPAKYDKRNFHKDFLAGGGHNDTYCLDCKDVVPECGKPRECASCGKKLPLCCPGRACVTYEPPRKKIRTGK